MAWRGGGEILWKAGDWAMCLMGCSDSHAVAEYNF